MKDLIRTMKEQRDPGGRWYCNCSWGDQPCAMSAKGRGKNTRDRCEGCSMGLHRGHTVRRHDA